MLKNSKNRELFYILGGVRDCSRAEKSKIPKCTCTTSTSTTLGSNENKNILRISTRPSEKFDFEFKIQQKKVLNVGGTVGLQSRKNQIFLIIIELSFGLNR